MSTFPQPRIVRQSIILCPHCGHSASEWMPSDACQFFYECLGCQTLLSPKPGDCCVFCSYGSMKCPPMQINGGCCDPEPATSTRLGQS